MQKCGWSAKVEVGGAWNAKLFNHSQIEMSGSIVVGAKSVLGTGPAVADVTSAMLQTLEETPRLLKERVIVAIACSIQPPDFACGGLHRQGVQHRHHWCCPDACAQQDDGAVAGPQGECASRSAYLQQVAASDLTVEIAARDSIRLMLHAHTVVIGTGSV